MWSADIYVYCPSGVPDNLEEELEAFFGAAADYLGAGGDAGYNFHYELAEGEDPDAWADRLKPFLERIGVPPGTMFEVFVGNWKPGMEWRRVEIFGADRRLTERESMYSLTCRNCGELNLFFSPPPDRVKCEHCGNYFRTESGATPAPGRKTRGELHAVELDFEQMRERLGKMYPVICANCRRVNLILSAPPAQVTCDHCRKVFAALKEADLEVEEAYELWKSHSVSIDSKSGSPDAREVFLGHAGEVESVAFSPDGRRALSGGADATVRLWSMESGNELRRFQEHTRRVNSVAFSPDGRRALSGGGDTLLLWDVESGRPVPHFQVYGGGRPMRSLLPGRAAGTFRQL